MRIAVLGATGIVAQKFIALLKQKTSAYEIVEVVASESKQGQSYESMCCWQEPLCEMPDSVKRLRLCRNEDISSDVVVSLLPGQVATQLESFHLQQGRLVFSNASAYRMVENVPILIPEINADHIGLLKEQSFPGKIITNSNCCVAGIALALAPLISFGFHHIHIVTLQSISGAGYPGISAMDIYGNTIPYIANEEQKIVRETLKILGSTISPAKIPLSVSVHRVPVVYGHMFSIHIMFDHPVNIDDLYAEYHLKNQQFPNTYQLHHSQLSPQVKQDLTHDDMRVHIGPIQFGANAYTIKMNVLIHNLVRGAAGALLANMQYYNGCEISKTCVTL